MFGSSFGDLALKRVWNHRTHTFADEFNVPQDYAVLVFDVRRPAVSLLFQLYEGLLRVSKRKEKRGRDLLPKDEAIRINTEMVWSYEGVLTEAANAEKKKRKILKFFQGNG